MGAVSHRIVTLFLLLVAAGYVHSECSCMDMQGEDDCKAFVECVASDSTCSEKALAVKRIAEETQCDKDKIVEFVCALNFLAIGGLVQQGGAAAEQALKEQFPCLKDMPDNATCDEVEKHKPCAEKFLNEVLEGTCRKLTSKILDNCEDVRSETKKELKSSGSSDELTNFRFFAMLAISLLFV